MKDNVIHCNVLQHKVLPPLLLGEQDYYSPIIYIYIFMGDKKEHISPPTNELTLSWMGIVDLQPPKKGEGEREYGLSLKKCHNGKAVTVIKMWDVGFV